MTKNKILQKLCAVMLISTLFVTFAKATIHSVQNTSDSSIYTFLKDTTGYNHGDTIMLVSEGNYIELKSIDIFKSVTILTDKSLPGKPIIDFQTGGFRFKVEGVDLILKGLIISGIKLDGNQIKSELITLNQWVDGDAIDTVKSIRILDCEVYGFQKGIRMGQFINCMIDTLIIDNVLWHNKDAASSAPILNYGEKGTAKYMSVTNSTFYNCGGSFMDSPLFEGKSGDATGWVGKLVSKKFIIDHNTFYNILTNNGSLLALHATNDASLDLTFSNNIISTILDPNKAVRVFRMNSDAGDIKITNNCFFGMTPANDKLKYGYDSLTNYSNVTLSNNIFSDPGFYSSSAGIFYISDTSIMATAGTDGGVIGDLRWEPVTGVTIFDIKETVSTNNDLQMEAIVNLGAGNDRSVAWSVINGTGTATINAASGILTPATAGTIQVVATSNFDNNEKDTLDITIEDAILINQFIIETVDYWWLDKSTTITVDTGFLYVNVTVMPLNASNKTYTAKVSDTSIAYLSDDFKEVYGKSNGDVWIIISANDGSATKDSIKITIAKNMGNVKVTNITVSGSDITDGQSITLTADIEPVNATNKLINWEISDENIATIDNNGVLTPKTNGTVTVTATSPDGPSNTITINISGVTSLSHINLPVINITPNPATDFIYINSVKKAEVTIVNITGKTEIHTTVQANAYINIENLNPGLFFVKIKIDEQVSIGKLIKQ